MADKIEDGGPAFPTIHGYVDSFGSLKQKSEGLSLRDYFAGQALAGILGSGDFLSPEGLFTGNGAPVIADAAFMISDAMLAARKGEL